MNLKKEKHHGWKLLLSLSLTMAVICFFIGFGRVIAGNTIGDIFHDQAAYEYMSNIEPAKSEAVTVKLRAEKGNLTSAILYYTADGSTTNFRTVLMTKAGEDATGYYEYWQGTIPGHTGICYYSFKATNRSGSVYYGARGKMSERVANVNCFRFIPGFSTPDWAKGANWYFINTDGFYNGDVHNDAADTETQKGVAWGSDLTGLMERYGGDLKGVGDKVDHFNSLSVDAVYLNPIWESRQNLGYGPLSYYKISPNLGTDADLIALSRTLHDNGMKLSLDAVFSYAMRDGVWGNQSSLYPLDGIYQAPEGTYKDMFTPTSSGGYESVWGNLRVDMSSSVAKNLFYQGDDSVLLRYLGAPYNIDAWRFDAVIHFYTGEQSADDISLEIRDSVKTKAQDTLLIAEDNLENLFTAGGWDTAYGIRGYFRRWFTGEYNQTTCAANLKDYLCRPRTSALCMLNLYDLHDETRISSDTQADAAKMRALVLCQMTFLGSPCIYYGDEVGVEDHKQDGFGAQSINCFNWNEEEWDMSLYRLHCALGELRREYSALKTGAIRYEVLDEDKALMTFGRFDKDGTVIAVTNQTDSVYAQQIDVKQYNVKDGAVLVDYLTGATYTVSNGCITMTVNAGGNILVTQNSAVECGKYKDIYTATASDDNVCCYEDFDDGSLQGFVSQGNGITIQNGLFSVVNADTPVTLLSSIPASDYTIKAKMSAVAGAEGEPVGVTAYADAENYVFAGRIRQNGKKYLVLGEAVNGKPVIHEKVADTASDSDCIVQLQKVGADFSAVYSYDGVTWNTIGKNVKCNYSVQKAGLYAAAGTSVSVDYVSFGDAVSDGVTVNTPCYPADIDVSFVTNAENTGLVKLSVLSGDKTEWQYVNGGIARTMGTGISQLAVQNRTFRDFRILVNLKPDEGGTCGVTMLRGALDETLGSSYALVLDSNGQLELRYGGSVVDSATVNVPDTGLDLAIERVAARMHVYIGEERELFFALDNVSVEKGYITYFVENTGSILNESIHSLTQGWTDVLGAYTQSFPTIDCHVISQSEALAYEHVSALGFTDVSFRATVTLSQVDTAEEAYTGIIIGAKERAVPEQSDGMLLALYQDGYVRLVKNKTVLAVSEKTYGSMVSLELIQKDDKVYSYVNGTYCAELSCKVSGYNGGVAGIVSNNSKGSYSCIALTDLANAKSVPVPEALPVYDEATCVSKYASDSRTVAAEKNLSFGVTIPEDETYYMSCTVTSASAIELLYRGNGFLYLGTDRYCMRGVNGKDDWVSAATGIENGVRVTVKSTPDKLTVWLNDVMVIKDAVLNTTGAGTPGVRYTYVEAALTDIRIWSKKPGAVLNGCTATLDGSIGMNFFLELNLTDEEKASDSTYMLFTVPGEEDRKVILKTLGADDVTVNGYKFTCRVPAKKMTDTITAQFYVNGEPCSEAYKYSVEAYAKEIINGDLAVYSEKAKNLAESMLHYGAYSQRYFSYNTGKLANRSLEAVDLSSVTAESFADFVKANKGELEGIGSNMGSSLVLESETTLKLYFKPEQGVSKTNLRFAYDGEELKTSEAVVGSNTWICIPITNIAAHKLADTIEITVSDITDSSKSGILRYSALTYGYNVLKNAASYSEELQNLVKALYFYSQTAAAYKNTSGTEFVPEA